MWRALLFLAAFCALAAFEFFVFPGHSYLEGDSQLFVPILEHIDHPGLLSRDLLAVHPNVTYTIYDEATLFFVRMAGTTLRRVLLGELFVFRFALFAGLYLFARSFRIGKWRSLALAGIVGCGACLPGACLHFVSREPTPTSFALGAVVLATGLLAGDMPVVGAIAAGVGLLYDPVLAAPFAFVLLGGSLWRPLWQRTLRTSASILLAFSLLLANLAQLQPEIPEPGAFTDRIPAAIQAIQRFAVPELWVSLWPLWAASYYVVAGACFLLAWRRGQRQADEPAVVVAFGLFLSAFGGVVFSLLLLDAVHWHEAETLQTTRLLLFFAASISVFFWSLTFLRWPASSPRRRGAALAVALVFPVSELASRVPLRQEPAVHTLSEWAADNTWGGSMFLFPDAGTDSYPGAFRAEARRAVWVDWVSRKQCAYFDSFADEWYRRWNDTMSGTYESTRLPRLLSLPIDYYVLRTSHRLPGVEAAYQSRDFVVYDAHALRKHLPCRGCLY